MTDADIVLGYMGTENFVGGSFKFSKSAAIAAIDKLAVELGVSRERCAWGTDE